MLIIIRGPSGSGKTTLAASNYPSFQSVEADMFFVGNDGVYRFNPRLLKHAHAWCQQRVRALLEEGLDVVVSNTFTQVWEMQPYLDMAAELGIEVEVVTAHGNFQNVHGVPPSVVAAQRARWEEYP